MRPSPGVTVLQYFFMSLAQALSNLGTLAVSFSRTVFPISVCAETEPTDKMASNGNNPSLASSFTVIFVERPLMTGSEPGSFVEVAAGSRWRLREVFAVSSLGPGKRETGNSKRQV